MRISAKEIARLVNGDLEGNPDAWVTRPGKIEEGGEGTLTFLANPKYEDFAYTNKTAVLLVGMNFQPARPIAAEALIRVEDVYGAIAFLLGHFGNSLPENKGVSKKAWIHPSALVGEKVSIGMFSVVEEGAQIGAGSVIFPQVFIGKDAVIGKNVLLYPGVKIYHNCRIGNHCVLHSNVVVGSDGFGFALQQDGTYLKIPQIGNVIVEEHVEIGANATLDRGTIGSTIIRRGTKLDNLVMIAHNVEIGENSVVAAQAGFAGSGKIGKNCQIGGQAGFVGHIQVADGTKVQAQSGVASRIEKPGTAVYGSPALPYKDYLRAYAVFKKLPELYKKIYELEKKLERSRQ
jgi:UDP-3-O-[3-hydroxymyristoyl] glucosamine N-acyltransferase